MTLKDLVSRRAYRFSFFRSMIKGIVDRHLFTVILHRKNSHLFAPAKYCFIMNERLFQNNQPVVKQAGDVSNIVYDEMRKHDANLYLVYVLTTKKDFEFDEGS